MKWIFLLVVNFSVCNAEVPFVTKITPESISMIPTQTSEGKLIVEFFKGEKQLSGQSQNYFLPTTKPLIIKSPKLSKDSPEPISMVLTIMKVHYELQESIKMFGSGPGQFRDAKSITNDIFNQVYIIDAAEDRVIKYNQKLQFLSQFGSFNVDNSQSFENDFGSIEEGQFDGVYDLLAGPRLTVFISDSHNDRIVEVDSSGNFVREFQPRDGFDEPTRLQGNSQNEILVLDSQNDRIIVFNSFGSQIFTIGGYGTGHHKFTRLIDFLVDSDDNLICLDQQPDKVLLKKYSRTGMLIKKKTLTGKYLRLDKDSLGYLYLIGDSDVKILDPDLRVKPFIFNQVEELRDLVALTALPNKNLITLHNSSSTTRIWVPQFKLLQSRIRIENSSPPLKDN